MALITIIGSGGHCRSVISTIKILDDWEINGIVDLEFRGQNETIMGHKVIGGPEFIKDAPLGNLVVAIGDNKLRETIVSGIKKRGFNFPNLINPFSFVDPMSEMNEGNFVGHGAFIGPVASIGSFNIINTGAILEHEAQLGNYCHMAPASTVCGRSIIGNNALLGAGSVVLPKIRVNSSSTIGSNSVVVKDTVGENETYVGIPARRRI